MIRALLNIPLAPPARPGATPPCLIFPGVVQFSVSVFSASTFSGNPPVVEICHFAGPPEAPTATADVAGGIPGWPRTRTATVRKLPVARRSPRQLRPHFPAGLLNRGLGFRTYSVEYATTRLKGPDPLMATMRQGDQAKVDLIIITHRYSPVYRESPGHPLSDRRGRRVFVSKLLP